MLTKIVLMVLYGADSCFIAFLVLGAALDDLFTGLALAVAFHLLVSMLLTRGLARFFPVQEGRFPIHSRECDRWLAQGVISIASSVLFDQFLPIFMKAGWYRLFGAKLDKDVVISGRMTDPFLVTMQHGSTLGVEAMILSHHIAKDHIVIGRVVVGANAMIGARALIMPNVEIGEHAAVGACAVVTSGKKVGAGETWVGIPAKPSHDRETSLNAEPPPGSEPPAVRV